MTTTLDRAIDIGAEWLEERRVLGALFVRYQIGIDLFGDGVSAWYCHDCGTPITDDIADGCPACGAGQPEDDSKEDAA